MDEIVTRGMAKWPDVPAVYGWLSLDRRGNWLIKDERIGNPLVTEFIGRNYARDERGCWYFQNGPQRVFVNLSYTPIVLRIISPEGAELGLSAHTGSPVASLGGAWMDENGSVLFETGQGPAELNDRDLERLLPYLTDANGRPLSEAALDELMELAQRGKPVPLWLSYRGTRFRFETIDSRDVPRRFAFISRPEPPEGEEVCR